MFEFEFNSEDVPVADQFPYARDLMSRIPASVELNSEHNAGFRLYQRTLRLDGLSAWTMTNQPMVVRRSPKLIRRSDPETFTIGLLQRGTIGSATDRHLARCGPYDLYVNDSSQPYEVRLDSPDAHVTSLGVEIPKPLLPLPRAQTDRLAGRLLSARDGVGALFARFLVELTAHPGSYRPTDGVRLGTVLTDLAAALFAHELEAESALGAESRQRTLVLRIRAFIRKHLHEPGLTPRAIAAANHISVSYLHRLFREEGTSVGAWMREQRLEGARRDLADHALAELPVFHIATRWGFSHPASFSRMFRAAYGVAPKEYRHQAPNRQEVCIRCQRRQRGCPGIVETSARTHQHGRANGSDRWDPKIEFGTA